MKNNRPTALIGFVNTEEIMAQRLMQEHALTDGYLLAPNAAFARACRAAYLMDDAFMANHLVNTLRAGNYGAILLGPIPACLAIAPILDAAGIRYIGATPDQMRFENDKTAIFEVFAPKAGILPKTETIRGASNQAAAARITEQLRSGYPNGYVIKFVGDYNAKYPGSPTGRVRLGTSDSIEEMVTFALASLEISGSVVLQEQCHGQEFSANYAVDAQGNFFRLGENVCYKHRFNGNTGPLCDGTGSVAINGSLPFLTHDDINFIEERVLVPFLRGVAEKTGRPLRTIVNLDMMKCADGRIVLFEVNCREAGGHTMATVLSGLRTPLEDVLHALHEDRLDTLPRPEFWPGASLVISAYPPTFPFGVAPGEDNMIFRIPKRFPADIHMYTGWVEILEEWDDVRMARLYNSPTMLFEHHAPTVAVARSRLLPVIRAATQGQLEFRDDIGVEFAHSDSADSEEEQ